VGQCSNKYIDIINIFIIIQFKPLKQNIMIKLFQLIFFSYEKRQEIADKKQAKLESWGKYEKSESGREWLLGRRLNWHVPHPDNPDSRDFLEDRGFKILGIEGKERYVVEPPKNLNMKPKSGYWNQVFNIKNEVIFEVFEKQEPGEFKYFITQ
jgi:hypothetical protein